MHITIVQGRVFDSGDREGSRRVAIVNEEFAKTYWPNQNSIGKRIRLNAADGPAAVVVGVAATGRYLLLWEAPRPYVYLPYMQNSRSRMTLIAGIARRSSEACGTATRGCLRHRPRPANIQSTRRRVICALVSGRLVDPSQNDCGDGVVGTDSGDGGLYSLISYMVSSRTPEIGVRIAVGATCRDVLWLVSGQGLRLAGSGIAIGGALTAALAPALAAGLAGMGKMDVSFLLIAPIALFAVSLAASYIPARRAAALDPVRALHYE